MMSNNVTNKCRYGISNYCCTISHDARVIDHSITFAIVVVCRTYGIQDHSTKGAPPPVQASVSVSAPVTTSLGVSVTTVTMGTSPSTSPSTTTRCARARVCVYMCVRARARVCVYIMLDIYTYC
jgi:hypothetical protein